jgi:hypothetical protein
MPYFKMHLMLSVILSLSNRPHRISVDLCKNCKEANLIGIKGYGSGWGLKFRKKCVTNENSRVLCAFAKKTCKKILLLFVC